MYYILVAGLDTASLMLVVVPIRFPLAVHMNHRELVGLGADCMNHMGLVGLEVVHMARRELVGLEVGRTAVVIRMEDMRVARINLRFLVDSIYLLMVVVGLLLPVS